MRLGDKGTHPGSIDNRILIKTVTGLSEGSQQRGIWKNGMYIT